MLSNYCTFFHNNLCHVCKIRSEQLKVCGNCKTLAYCSKEHQKQDWKIHKDICKVISTTENNFSEFIVKSYEDYQSIRYIRCTAWQNRLNRPLENFENQMWMFPRVCAVCYSKDVKIDCKNCNSILYCSNEHQASYEDLHKHYCDLLKLSIDFDVNQMYNEFKFNNLKIGIIPDDIKSLPNNLIDLMNLYNNNFLALDEIIRIKICDYAAPSANILYCLEQSGLLSDRNLGKETLSIHLIGADIIELSWDWTMVFEIIFHWIKDLKKLHFILVGPELDQSISVKNIDSEICMKCKEKEVRATCTYYSKMYHDILDELDQPDLVVAFNSGLHAYDENCWGKSISFLTKYYGVPLLLTAYTSKELQCDVDIVLKNSSKELKIIIEPQRNPFSCTRPMRDFNTLNVPIFYVNGYIAIFTKISEV